MKMLKNIPFLFIVVTLIGCGIEQRPSSEVKYFLLDVERSEAEVIASNTSCLRVRPCRIATSFAGRSLVYRTSSVLYEQDYYNLFLTNPDDQITDAMRAWFRQVGYADCILLEKSETEKYTLEPSVNVLCADFTDEQKPVAVVQMHVQLTKFDESCSCPKMVFEKTFTAQTALPAKPAAAQVVKGLSSALSKILQQLENELQKTIQ